MLQKLFSIRQFRLTKWSFLVHSTTRNAPFIHPSHDSILELWWTFPSAAKHVHVVVGGICSYIESYQMTIKNLICIITRNEANWFSLCVLLKFIVSIKYSAMTDLFT